MALLGVQGDISHEGKGQLGSPEFSGSYVKLEHLGDVWTLTSTH